MRWVSKGHMCSVWYRSAAQYNMDNGINKHRHKLHRHIQAVKWAVSVNGTIPRTWNNRLQYFTYDHYFPPLPPCVLWVPCWAAPALESFHFFWRSAFGGTLVASKPGAPWPPSPVALGWFFLSAMIEGYVLVEVTNEKAEGRS
jgi:hypothetical protein